MQTIRQEAVVVGAPPGLLETIQAEYLEMPGLCLTLRQAARLWNVDAGTCATVLDGLVRLQFLGRTRDGAYVRRDPR